MDCVSSNKKTLTVVCVYYWLCYSLTHLPSVLAAQNNHSCQFCELSVYKSDLLEKIEKKGQCPFVLKKHSCSIFADSN